MYWIRMYLLCTSNPATLKEEFRNGVGLIPVGVTVWVEGVLEGKEPD